LYSYQVNLFEPSSPPRARQRTVIYTIASIDHRIYVLYHSLAPSWEPSFENHKEQREPLAPPDFLQHFLRRNLEYGEVILTSHRIPPGPIIRKHVHTQPPLTMLRTSTSIELEEYPQTPISFTAVTQPPSVHPKDGLAASLADDLRPINVPITDIEHLEAPGKKTTAIVLVTVVCITMISSMLSGVTAVVLPTMARDLHLAPSVLLWYLNRPKSLRQEYADSTQARFHLRAYVWLYTVAPGLSVRRGGFEAHVSNWLCTSISLHTRLWSFEDWHATHRLPRFRRRCDFVLSTFSR
jgi:hypothetical protein